MADWTHEMKNRDQALQEMSGPGLDLPAVRQMKNSKLVDKQEAGPSRIKTMVPRDYSEWDKFDVDKEILKMELEDERKKEQLSKKKKQQEKEKKKSKNEGENSALKATSNISSEEKEYMATQEKDRGNEYYRSGDFEEAVKCYSKSIVLYPTPAAYNNRAMAQLKLQKYREAISDCNQVLEAQPQNVKALHRRGSAYQGKNCYEQAYEDFSKVLELEPDNQVAKFLADKMKKKFEPAVKSVRLSIEDECYQPHGFVFPSPKPNIPVNEWGLAKVMCRCNGTPSWVHKKPPKCKVCQRKRADRRAKREEEARKLEMNVGAGNDNSDIDQMQTDEKGSGDMRAREKIVELDDSILVPQDAVRIKIEEVQENVDNRMNSTVESAITTDEKDTSYTCSIINKENSEIERGGQKDNSRSNDIGNCKIVSAETNKSKPEFECDTKVLPNESTRRSAKEIKQKSSSANDNPSGKPVKVKIANKYKRNSSMEKETISEQQESADVSSMGTINTPFEFVKVWESLKVTADLSSHAQVLHSVKPSDLASVIGNKLDGPMLSIILRCLEKNFDPELVLEYLNNIMQLPRFNIVKMFMEPPDKEVVSRLLEKLESSNVHPPGALWKAFTC